MLKYIPMLRDVGGKRAIPFMQVGVLCNYYFHSYLKLRSDEAWKN
jgi:hypothetical protein